MFIFTEFPAPLSATKHSGYIYDVENTTKASGELRSHSSIASIKWVTDIQTLRHDLLLPGTIPSRAMWWREAATVVSSSGQWTHYVIIILRPDM